MKRLALGLTLSAVVMGAGMAADAVLPVTSGLVCWYDAAVGVIPDGSGVIQTWDDQSGNAHHGTRASGAPVLAADQLNSKPAAQFRGSYINLAGSLFVKEQYLVMRSPTATWSGGGGFLCRKEGRGSSYNMRGDHDVTFWPDQAPDAVSKNGTSIPAESLDNSQYVLQPITGYMILKIVVNDNDTSAASYQIGRADTGTIDFDVVEIVGYDRTLSTEEEASMGSYLADKYDLITAYPVLTPQAKILSFGLPGMPAVVDQSAMTIAWTVPAGTVPSSLAPEFTLSDGATCDHVSGTAYNFTSPVNYIVTPSVGAPKTYTVAVTVDPQLSALPVGRGLVCWYDASVGVTTDKGVIQTWNDLSGQAHHGVRIKGSPTLVPDLIHSRPAAQFRGAYLSLDNPFFAKEQYVVVR